MRQIDLVEQSLQLLRDASPNSDEQNSMKIYNKFFNELVSMEKEVENFKLKNPNHEFINTKVQRLSLMRSSCVEFMQTYFSMMSYKEKAISAQADLLSMHSKYEDVKQKLMEYEFSNKIEHEE